MFATIGAMKRLSLPQPMVLLMIGIPGAGKSFFARQFAETYNLPHISVDRIRAELFEQPQYSGGEQERVNRIVDYMVEEQLRSGASFILDGLQGNVRVWRASLERQAREKGYKVLLVWVQLDTSTAKSRSTRRNAKKQSDRFNTSLPENVFNTLSKQLTAPSNENYVVISGKHGFMTQHKAVLRKLFPLAEKNPEQPSIKVATPTPERHIGKPTPRPENRRITIS